MDSRVTILNLCILVLVIVSQTSAKRSARPARSADACVPQCTSNATWRRTTGGLDTLAVGPAGMWGVNSANQVWYRDSTYGNPGNFGSGWDWTFVNGSMRRLDVGDDVVWGITVDGYLTCRLGIHANVVTGCSWLPLRTKAIDVAISPNGLLVAISENGTLFYRQGLSSQCAYVDEWVSDADTSLNLKQVSVGRSGIWVVDTNNTVHYRTLSFGDNGYVGTGWAQVDKSMKWVAAGQFFVMGVNDHDEIWRLNGVTATTPTGTNWVKLTGALKNVDAYDGCYAWGVKGNDEIYLGSFQ